MLPANAIDLGLHLGMPALDQDRELTDQPSRAKQVLRAKPALDPASPLHRALSRLESASGEGQNCKPGGAIAAVASWLRNTLLAAQQRNDAMSQKRSSYISAAKPGWHRGCGSILGTLSLNLGHSPGAPTA